MPRFQYRWLNWSERNEITLPFKISIRTTLIFTAVLAVVVAVIVYNPTKHSWLTTGISVGGGGGPVSFLEAYSDLLKSAESLQLTPTQKPTWAANPRGNSNSWFVVNEGDATIWVQVSADRHYFDASVIGHKDCLPWQDVTAEQELSKKTAHKLDQWWRKWSTDNGWPEY